jgi:monoamine oxidase
VISSLPIGVLKAGDVKFVPDLPERYTKIIEKIGVGNMNKLFVRFGKKFWGGISGWLNFVTKDTSNNRYPLAMDVSEGDKYILCFFVAGKGSRDLHSMSK